MSEKVREICFEKEYEILQKEAKRLFNTETGKGELPFANRIVRRALRCIRKLKNHYELLENKHTAKKPFVDKGTKTLGCPICGQYLQTIIDEDSTDGNIPKYCVNCGQKIDPVVDWSDIDD